MKNKSKKLTLAGLFLTLGIVLPFMTMQLKEIGDSLLPMHFVILLCGLMCGCKYGLVCGFILPVLRSLLFGMPPLFPNAVWMSLELATYGFTVALFYRNIFKRRLSLIYPSLIIAMVTGRIVWGVAKYLILGLSGKPFTLALFISQGFIDGLMGIALQLIFIPLIIKLSEKKINLLA